MKGIVISCAVAMGLAGLGYSQTYKNLSSIVVTNGNALVEIHVQHDRVVGNSSLGLMPHRGLVVAAGDFDGNGSLDLVLQYDPDGAGAKLPGTFLWLYGTTGRTSIVKLGGIATDYTKPVGAADIDGDGQLAYLLQSPTSKMVKAFKVSKTTPPLISDSYSLLGGTPTYTNVVGVAGADHDTDPDL